MTSLLIQECPLAVQGKWAFETTQWMAPEDDAEFSFPLQMWKNSEASSAEEEL